MGRPMDLLLPRQRPALLLFCAVGLLPPTQHAAGPVNLYHRSPGRLNATLAPVHSHHAITVVRVHAASLPAAATWLHIRPGDGQPMPEAVVPDGSTANGSWFPARRQGGEVQEFAFAAADTFNAGSQDGVPPCTLKPHQTRRFVLEAWLGRSDVDGSKAQLLSSSGSLTFTFDDDGFASSQLFGNFSATELGQHAAGCVTVTAAIANATAFAQAGLVTWFGFRPLTHPPAGKGGRVLPYFTLDTMLLGDQYSTRGNFSNTVNITFSTPGTYFVGIYGAWNGEYGFWFPLPENGVRTVNSFPLDQTSGTTFQPLAIRVPWENGSLVDLPAHFDGPIYTTKPIPGNQRAALRVSSVTVFDGGTLYIHNVKGPPGFGIDIPGPRVLEIDVPTGLRILNASGTAFNVTDVSMAGIGGPLAEGYTRLQLINHKSDQWAFSQWTFGKMQIEVVDPTLTGRTFQHSQLRAYDGTAANRQRQDNWQPYAITVKELKPVPVLPKRLHTAFCWGGASEFVDNPARNLSSISMYKKLGFNVIPNDGAETFVPGTTKSPVMSPKQRTGPDWAGMKFGLMFGGGMVGPAILKASVATTATFNLSQFGLTTAEEATERNKWRFAAEFYALTKVMDLSYDGIFYQDGVRRYAATVNYSQADFLSLDIEVLPEFGTWASVAYKSANFVRRLHPGEANSAATLRIARSWLGGLVDAAEKARPGIRPYLYSAYAKYDHGFQLTTWPMLKSMGFGSTPSYYQLMNSLDSLAAFTRAERLAIGNNIELNPWITPGQTPGTDGQPPTGSLPNEPRVFFFNALIQLFGSGATGFNIYTADGFIDMGMWLAIRDAIELVTPYEDLICDGFPAPRGSLHSLSSSAVVNAMVDDNDGTLLIASSTMPAGVTSSFVVQSAKADDSWLLCDLATKRSVVVSASGKAVWASKNELGSILVFGPATVCHKYGRAGD